MRSWIILFCSLLFVSLASSSDGGWLIDHRRFHISMHGQLSCADCHRDIVNRNDHPDPSAVNKDSNSFFRLKQCTSCHTDVPAELKDGLHGGMIIVEKDASCIRCHDPHYRFSLTEFTDFAFPWLRHKQCDACHAERKKLPDLSAVDSRCMSCHRSGQNADEVTHFCFSCHGRSITSEEVRPPILDFNAYRRSSHAGISCLSCHSQAAAFKHNEQERRDCRHCHTPHPEKVSHDAHLTVDCEACHLRGDIVRNPLTGRITWRGVSEEPVTVHNMMQGNERGFCQRCHHPGNVTGAASLVLPAKSVICMPCHTASLVAADPVTALSLVAFLVGVVFLASLWFTGARGSEEGGDGREAVERASVSIVSKAVTVLKALFFDALLQRRLFQQSGIRWLIHALIFFPIVLRFSWGLLALIISSCAPTYSFVWVMLDKNHPVTALFFELTGFLIISGILLAVIRSARQERVPHLPGRDWLAFGLIGGLLVAGFILEGMRIAMTGHRGFDAFIGSGIALLFSGISGLSDIYGYVWYAHAILTGILVAYFPFSRLFHIVMAPIVLVMRALNERERRLR